ncbi:collagen alpha-1(I) chain [Mustela putorius furo]|uniref:Collagen alpha-1(I) chain n=1 Tax=Mustela putorius furo TaxID=9669 RepID=A0A8U0SJT0_MUSPF|nr:collagen alpha-1(I) chain [Mustela putorius furo]
MAPEGGSHSPARLRSQHMRGHCCGTYKRTRSSPTHGHRSRKGFTQPCAKAWRPRTNPPCRHDGPQPGQGKAVADSDLAGALGQPPAPPAWTKASFLHYFPLWFGDLLVPALLPSGNQACRTQNTAVVVVTCPFSPVWGPSQQGLHLPLPKGDAENVPRTGYQLTLKKPSGAKKQLPRKPQRMKSTRLGALTRSGSGFHSPAGPRAQVGGGRGALPGHGRDRAARAPPARGPDASQPETDHFQPQAPAHVTLQASRAPPEGQPRAGRRARSTLGIRGGEAAPPAGPSGSGSRGPRPPRPAGQRRGARSTRAPTPPPGPAAPQHPVPSDSGASAPRPRTCDEPAPPRPRPERLPRRRGLRPRGTAGPERPPRAGTKGGWGGRARGHPLWVDGEGPGGRRRRRRARTLPGRRAASPGRARAPGGRGRPRTESARRERPRTRKTQRGGGGTRRAAHASAEAQRGAERATPGARRGYGEREGPHRARVGWRVRAGHGREAGRAARPPRAFGPRYAGAGLGPGPPPPSPGGAARLAAPGNLPCGRAPGPGRGGTPGAPENPGGGGATRGPRPRRCPGGGEGRDGARGGRRGARRDNAYPSIAHGGDPQGTEWRRRNSRNRPNGSEL